MDTCNLSRSLLIFGCGYVGLELARQSLNLGWAVTAFTRNIQAARKAEELGAKSVTGILQDREWWDQLSPEYDHVVNSVGAYTPSLEGYHQSYLLGMKSIVDWLEQTNGNVRNLLFTSSSSVYPQTDGSLVNEKSGNQGSFCPRENSSGCRKGLPASIGKIGSPQICGSFVGFIWAGQAFIG